MLCARVWLCQTRLNLESEAEPSSAGIYSDTISPQTVTKRVVSGELILKFNKKSKGTRAWDQFRLVCMGFSEE